MAPLLSLNSVEFVGRQPAGCQFRLEAIDGGHIGLFPAARRRQSATSRLSGPPGNRRQHLTVGGSGLWQSARQVCHPLGIRPHGVGKRRHEEADLVEVRRRGSHDQRLQRAGDDFETDAIHVEEGIDLDQLAFAAIDRRHARPMANEQNTAAGEIFR